MAEIKPTTVKIPPDLDHAVSELGFATRTDAIRRGLEVLLVVADILGGADISRLTVEEIKNLLAVEGEPDTSPLRQAIREEVRAALAPEHPMRHFNDAIRPLTEADWERIQEIVRGDKERARMAGVQTEESPTHFSKGEYVGPRPGEGHTFAISGDDDPSLRHTMGAERFQGADLQGENGPEASLKSAYEIFPGDIATLISIRWKRGEEPLIGDVAEVLGVEESSLGRRLGEMGVTDRPRVRIEGRGRVRKIPASDVNRRAVEATMGSHTFAISGVDENAN